MYLAVFIPVIIVGLIVGGVGLSEIIEEIMFKKKALKTKGSIIQQVAARYKPKVQFKGFEASSGVTESTDVRSLKGYIGVVEYEAKDGYLYTSKTKHVINYDTNTLLDVYYNPDDPTDVMIDSYYKMGKEKYFRLLGGLVFIILPIVYAFYIQSQMI